MLHQPHFAVLGMPSANVTTGLPLPPPCSSGGGDRTYPNCSYLQYSLSRPDAHLLTIVINHRRRARCGLLVMCIWGRRSDFWILPIPPLDQPRARRCFSWDIAKLESVRWHRHGFMLVWLSAWPRTSEFTRARINGHAVGRHCLLLSNYRSVAGSGMPV